MVLYWMRLHSIRARSLNIIRKLNVFLNVINHFNHMMGFMNFDYDLAGLGRKGI